jgi:hypothetical protein
MKIGDIIWYRRVDGGYLYTEAEIVGETSLSWKIIRSRGYYGFSDFAVQGCKSLNIPKSLKGLQIGTAKDAALTKWAVDHSVRIAKLVALLGDNPALMLKVAALVGYAYIPENEEENSRPTAPAPGPAPGQ